MPRIQCPFCGTTANGRLQIKQHLNAYHADQLTWDVMLDREAVLQTQIRDLRAHQTGEALRDREAIRAYRELDRDITERRARGEESRPSGSHVLHPRSRDEADNEDGTGWRQTAAEYKPKGQDRGADELKKIRQGPKSVIGTEIGPLPSGPVHVPASAVRLVGRGRGRGRGRRGRGRRGRRGRGGPRPREDGEGLLRIKVRV